MGFEEFGIVIEDAYVYQHPEDNKLWLDLLCKAREIDLNFYAVLHYLRSIGTILVKDEKFNYRLQPHIHPGAWESIQQWEEEKQYLVKYQKDLIRILKEL